MIPVFKPSYGEEELEALREPFETGWIGLGPKTREFEQKFAEFIGVPHAIGVNSATAALHLALKLADVEGAEVITTPMTFISPNPAILYNGGIPVFADIEPDTLNIDPSDVRRKITPRTKAIVVVHYGGHACDMEAILDIAQEHGLKVIEDCAHGCGGEYIWRGHGAQGTEHGAQNMRQKLGSLGDFGCFSFHAVKNLATGDGGMITTRDAEADARLRKLCWLGISRGTWDRTEGTGYSWEYNVEELGFKYHMNDITAALGLVQLAKLERTNARRRELAERYTAALSGLDWLETPVEKDYARSAWHNYVIKVREAKDRNPLMAHLKTQDISTGMHYIPNHLYEMYRPYVREHLPVAESVWKRLITLPLFPDLTDEELQSILTAIRRYPGG
ncbi:MAG: DegT/DnrJ/EryC1/StrS aminotransferase family protein [candidate division WOR-3 bacterium]